jgi:hypothetical protein
MILCLLLVCRMVRGSYPCISLLKKYSLADLYGPLILALTSGDYNTYHAHLIANQKFFMSIQCFSILKFRTEQLILRNLFFQGYMHYFYEFTNRLRMMGEVFVSCEILFLLCKFAQIPEWIIQTIDDVEATVVSMIDMVYTIVI